MGIDLLQLLIFNEEFLVIDGSSDRRDYVPALCTHRPSLLPIEQSGEYFGPDPVGATRSGTGKSS